MLGPDRGDVEKTTNTPVKPLIIRESRQPGHRVTDGELQIYMPQVQRRSGNGQNPAPAKVMKRNEVRPAAERNAENRQEVNPIDNRRNEAQPPVAVPQVRNQQPTPREVPTPAVREPRPEEVTPPARVQPPPREIPPATRIRRQQNVTPPDQQPQRRTVAPPSDKGKEQQPQNVVRPKKEQTQQPRTVAPPARKGVEKPQQKAAPPEKNREEQPERPKRNVEEKEK
jgi:hypothetical protein